MESVYLRLVGPGPHSRPPGAKAHFKDSYIVSSENYSKKVIAWSESEDMSIG